MTQARPWPNSAKEARDRSAEEAARALRMLELLLDKEVTETEKIRRLAIAINSLNTILRLPETASRALWSGRKKPCAANSCAGGGRSSKT